MEKRVTLKEQLDAFGKGIFLDSDGEVSHCYNFYDWFCKEKALKNRAKVLYSKAKSFLKHHPEIDQTKVYIWFKNNCPMMGPLYDDFRIADVETGDVIWTVIPKEPRSEKAEIWGRINGFQGPYKVANTYPELFK